MFAAVPYQKITFLSHLNLKNESDIVSDSAVIRKSIFSFSTNDHLGEETFCVFISNQKEYTL